MTGVIADVAAMQAAAGHVESVNGELERLLRRLRGEAEDSRASWEGEAQVAFQSLMQRYDDASLRLHQRLQTIADLIRQNGRGYDTTNQDFTSTLGNVGGGGSLNLS